MKMKCIKISLLIVSVLSVNFSFAQWTEDASGVHLTDPNKYVGIGNSTPAAPLDINNNILLGLNNPAYGVRIKANWPGYNGGWSRGFYIANEDNSKNYFGLGVSGEATAGVTTMSYAWLGKNYNDTYMNFLENGNVGIGIPNPQARLEVSATIRSTYSSEVGPCIELSNPSKTGTNDAAIWRIFNMSGGYGNSLQFWGYSNTVNLGPKLTIKDNGNVGIGTTTPTEKLSVNGNIKAKKLIVTQTGWADYVFDKAYKLMPVDSLSTYINTHKHLPEMPTTKDVQDHGVDVGNNQTLLLKKIEELTLYIIEQHKQLAQQNERIQKLEKSKN